MGIFDIFKTSKTSYKKVFAEYIRQQELISPVIFLAFQANHSEILSDNPKYSEEIKKLLMVVYFYGALDGMAFLIDEKKELNDSIVLACLRGALSSSVFGYSEDNIRLIMKFLEDNFNERWFFKIHIQGVEAIDRFWKDESKKEHPNIYKSLQVGKIFDDHDLLMEALPFLQKQYLALRWKL